MGRNNHALVTGLFLLVLISATVAFAYWLGQFERERNRYVISTNASVSGLTPESTVFYRGIAVGKVLKVEFDPQNSNYILIPIEVDKNIQLTKGVFATLRLKGVTGLTQIQLEDDLKITGLLPPGDSAQNRIPLVPSLTDKLLNSGEELLRKADHLMQRLDSLLSPENEKNVTDILSNLKLLSDKLKSLQSNLDKALNEVPALSANAKKTLNNVNELSGKATNSLKHIDDLAENLKVLTKEVHQLSTKARSLADTGEDAGEVLTQSTLPKINKLLTDLQATTQQVKRVATHLENDPQELLLGPSERDSGPGEPEFNN